MKKIIEQSGKTLKEFAEFYEIPYNTVRQWYNGERSAPSWVKGLIEKAANGIQTEIEIPDFYMIETKKPSPYLINGYIDRTIYTNKEQAEEERKFEEKTKQLTRKEIKFYELKIIKR